MSINGIAVGDAGGISVGEEAVAYGTLAALMVHQHPKTSSMGVRKTLRPPKQLATVVPVTRDYTIAFADGGIVLGHDASRAVIGPVLANLGNLSTDDYIIGDGSAPDTASVSINVNIDGHMMQYLGCKATRVRWDFTADQEITITVDFLDRSGTKVTAITVVNPDEAGIAMAGDLTPITLGTNSLCILSGFIQADIPHTAATRVCLGASYIKEPQRVGPVICTGSLTVELADETDNDTEAELDHYLAGTAAGDLVIGDFQITDAWLTGETPNLAAGIIQFPLTLEGQTIIVTTTA